MKTVTIVGLGLNAASLTTAGRTAIEQADLLIGAPRLLAQVTELGKPTIAAYAPEKVASIIRAEAGPNFCLLVSGDVGFYSAAGGFSVALRDYQPRLIPGVSSLSYFCACLGRPWQDMALISCHGREENLADTVRRNRLTFALTGGNMAGLGQVLSQAGFGSLPVMVGEDLGLATERILTLTAAELAAADIGDLAVLLVENPRPDQRLRLGIPDGEFIRGGAPMTKAEIRAVALSRLAPWPGAICADIGAGTGSVTVELALAAYAGRVYAIEQDPAALALVAANCRRFHLGNVTLIQGRAPAALAQLPALDIAFIGGSSGSLPAICAALFSQNPRLRLAMNAITLETLEEALAAFASQGMEPAVSQISLARLEKVGARHMLRANSPVFVISGGGDG